MTPPHSRTAICAWGAPLGHALRSYFIDVIRRHFDLPLPGAGLPLCTEKKFICGKQLSITDYKDGKAGEPNTVEIPAGAAPIFPAGAHQVKNIGESEAIVMFVEELPICTPCGDIEGFVAPFTCSPACYKIHAENDNWITGELNMQPGDIDELHNHRDHLIYCLEGEEITIYPDGDLEQGKAVPLHPGRTIPLTY